MASEELEVGYKLEGRLVHMSFQDDGSMVTMGRVWPWAGLIQEGHLPTAQVPLLRRVVFPGLWF